MSDRDKKLVLLLSVTGVGLVGFGVYLFVWSPLLENHAQAQAMAKANAKKLADVQQIEADLPNLAKWRKLALPLPAPAGKPAPVGLQTLAGVDKTMGKYQTFLWDLARAHQVDNGFRMRQESMQGGQNPKGNAAAPVFTPFQFSVTAQGKLASLAAMLVDFQKAPFLHRISHLTITHAGNGKPSDDEPLQLTMAVEVLVINAQRPLPEPQWLKFFEISAAHPRETLYPPTSPPRNYASLGIKNIFVGDVPIYKTKPAPPPPAIVEGPKPLPPPPKARPTEDVIKYAYLTDITRDEDKTHATLWDRLVLKSVKLRPQPGYGFPLLVNADKFPVVKAEVVRIEGRSVIFQVLVNSRDPSRNAEKPYPEKDRIYRLHPKDLEELIAKKMATEADAPRIVVMQRAYYDALVRDKVMRVTGNSNFYFKYDLVQGRIFSKDEKLVRLQLDEKYCGFRDDSRDVRVAAHVGYCDLEVGECVLHSLQNPVPESVVREFAVQQAQGQD